jgi:hypothetical protein
MKSSYEYSSREEVQHLLAAQLKRQPSNSKFPFVQRWLFVLAAFDGKSMQPLRRRLNLNLNLGRALPE